MSAPKTKRIGFAWPVLGLAVLAVLSLAAVGLSRMFHAAGQPLGFLDLIYNLMQICKGSLQLPFISDPFRDEPALRLARVLAPLVLLAITGKVGWALLSNQITALTCRWMRGHVLICGAGHKGRLMAEQFLEKGGHKVVVLEVDPQNDALLELKAKGARVLIGNAADKVRLQLAGASRAAYFFAVTNSDETNLEIALEAAALRKETVRQKSAPADDLRIFAHVASPQLRELFESQPPFCRIDQAARQQARLFDCVGTAAWALLARELEKLQCHRQGDPGPSFLLCGEGHFVEELLRQIIIVAHLGNGRKPDITVVTTDRNLKRDYEQCFLPQISMVAEVRFVDVSHHCFGVGVSEGIEHRPVYDLAAVSFQSDVDTFQWTESLARDSHFGRPDAGGADVPFKLGALDACLLPSSSLSALQTGKAFAAPVISLAREGCNLEVLLDEKLDLEAKQLHQAYLILQSQKPPDKRSPLAVPWEQLPAYAREDNRSAALHNRLKRAARRVVGPADTELRERLAAAEHTRWMANRIVHGWRRGPRDDAAKRHPNLVPYQELDEDTKKYDRINVDEAWAAAS